MQTEAVGPKGLLSYRALILSARLMASRISCDCDCSAFSSAISSDSSVDLHLFSCDGCSVKSCKAVRASENMCWLAALNVIESLH